MFIIKNFKYKIIYKEIFGNFKLIFHMFNIFYNILTNFNKIINSHELR